MKTDLTLDQMLKSMNRSSRVYLRLSMPNERKAFYQRSTRALARKLASVQRNGFHVRATQNPSGDIDIYVEL